MADLSQFGKSKGKPQLSPYQEGVSKALKQSGEQHASEAISAGVLPQHIEQQAGLVDPQTLQQLSQLANMQMPMKGDGSFLGNKVGVLPAILKTLTGTPTSPFATKTQSLGLDNAIQVAGFQQTANKNSMDMQKFPGEMEQQALQNTELKQKINPDFQLEQSRRQEEMKADVRAQEEQKKALQKEQLETEKTFNQVINLNDNLVSTLKGAYSQQGGEGLIPGMIGNVKAAIGMPNTGNIKALKAVKRDTAISYARQLAGGARGVATFFRSVLDSLPDNKFTSEQAGTTIAELSLTAYAMKKGINDLKLSQDQINGLSPDQVQTLADKERSNLGQDEQDKIYAAIQDRFSKIAPRKSINLEGRISNNIQKPNVPMQHQAPKGAKGWDTEKKAWVY